MVSCRSGEKLESAGRRPGMLGVGSETNGSEDRGLPDFIEHRPQALRIRIPDFSLSSVTCSIIVPDVTHRR